MKDVIIKDVKRKTSIPLTVIKRAVGVALEADVKSVKLIKAKDYTIKKPGEIRLFKNR